MSEGSDIRSALSAALIGVSIFLLPSVRAALAVFLLRYTPALRARSAAGVFLLLLLFPFHTHAATLGWGYEDNTAPQQILIQDGGSYSVPLHVPAPAVIFAFATTNFTGTLYHVNARGVRDQVVAEINCAGCEPVTTLSWPSAGKYELDLPYFPPPILVFSDALKKWLALAFFANIANAQSDEIETIHFTIESDQPTCTQNCFDNVLFLPGIEASRLYESVNGNEKKVWEPGVSSDALDLMMNPDGSSVRSDIYTRDVLDNAYVPGKGNVYQSFIADMNNLKSTGAINDWESAPYDWRLTLDQVLSSGAQSGQNISYLTATDSPFIIQELKRLAQTSKSGKVTIIAHSNGGLVAKALMQKLGSTTTAQFIDKVILVAVPQIGTPQALTGLLHGYDQALPFSQFPYALHDDTARQVGDTMPGLYTMLPSTNYFTYVDDPVITISSSTLPDWAARYGDIIHSQVRQHNFLTDTLGRSQPATNDLIHPTILSDSFLSQAEAVHALLDSWTPPPGVRVIQIAGWGIPTTVKGISYASTSKSAFCNGVCSPGGLTASLNTTIDGDGTVVVPSALWVSTTTGAMDYWTDLAKYNSLLNKIETGHAFKVTHASILEVQKLLDFVSDNITNSLKPLANYNYLSLAAPPATENRLRYALHSPLSLDFYDNIGRHTGISTSTGEIDEQIPGTYYTEFDDVKYIFTGTSSPVHIYMNGYATSTFTFNADELSGDTVVASTTFKDIPTTPNTLVTLNNQSDIASLSPMSVDENGDGNPDITLSPKLNDTVIADMIAPEARITFSTTTQAILITGIDETSTTTVTSTTTYPALKPKQTIYRGVATTTVMISDASNNKSILVYTRNLPQPAGRVSINLASMSYGGSTSLLATSTQTYKWRNNPDTSYSLFVTRFGNASTTLESHWNPKKKVTIIITPQQDVDDSDADNQMDATPVRQKLNGMIVPFLITKNGKINISY